MDNRSFIVNLYERAQTPVLFRTTILKFSDEKNHFHEVLLDNPPDENDLRQEIKSRIEKLSSLSSYISRETKKFIKKAEKRSLEAIRIIDARIKQYSEVYVNLELFNEDTYADLLKSLTNRQLNVVYYPMKNLSTFYKKQFLVEHFKIPKAPECRQLISGLFPYIKENLSSITCVAISADESRIALGKADNKIVLYDNHHLKLLNKLVELEDTVQTVNISNDNQYIIAGLLNRSVLIWNLISMKKLKVFQSIAVHLKQVLFTNDLKYIVCTGNSGDSQIIEVRNLKTFEPLPDLPTSKWLIRHPEVAF